MIVPSSLGLVLPEFPLSQRATATSLWGAMGAIAAATGPSLGGVLVHATSWRWAFFVNLAIGLPAIVPARRLLRESHIARGERMPDAVGVVLAIFGVGAVSLGIVKGPDWNWGDGRTLATLAAGAVLLAAFVRRSSRHPSPVVELELFRVRSFAAANAALLLFSMGFFAMLLCNVLFLTGVWHYSVLEAGIGITPGPVMAAVGAVAGGRLSDRFGQRVVAVPGTLLFAAGTLLLSLRMGAHAGYAADFLPATMIGGVGVGLSFSSLSSAAVAELPPARFSTGGAVASGFRQLGAVLGISILVAILATPTLHDFHEAYALMSAAAVLAAAVALGLGRVRARDGVLASAEAAA
jgi:MFS family permease